MGICVTIIIIIIVHNIESLYMKIWNRHILICVLLGCVTFVKIVRVYRSYFIDTAVTKQLPGSAGEPPYIRMVMNAYKSINI